MKSNALGIIFSNMHDEAMQELTQKRTMASVPFGGRYRLIDFMLSSMYNSGITKVGVITKNNYQSLLDHLGSGKEWDLSHKREGLYILPPFGRSQSGVYKSRVDALSGVLDFIRRSTNENVILADCDDICNFDFRQPLRFHNDNRADITVICRRQPPARADRAETVAYTLDAQGRVTELIVNPEEDTPCLAGLHMWIVRKGFLEHIVADAVSRGVDSWVRGVLQASLHRGARLFGYEFDGYVGHIGCMSEYLCTNMDLLNPLVREELFYRYGHIYTKVRDEPPAKYGAQAVVRGSLVADGCVIEGEVEDSILFRGVTVGRGAKISRSIVMQSTRVEDGAELRYVILDKDVLIKNSRVLIGYESFPLYIGKGSMV